MTDALVVLLWDVWPMVAAVVGIGAIEVWRLGKQRDDD